jgi:hypothetical protein
MEKHLSHLIPEEIERIAEARSGSGDANEEVRAHLDACPRCRDDVDTVLAVLRSLEALPRMTPSAGFVASVIQRIDLPSPWLDQHLAAFPRVAPAPGFATAVMARVRLPVAWHERVWRLARQRRVAIAAVAASLVAITATGAAWLFGVQGVTPIQLVQFLARGGRDLAIRGLLEIGRLGYELGLVDAGSTIGDRISPTTAVGSLALASVVGLTSLWVMMRLMRGRAEPRAVRLRSAA